MDIKLMHVAIDLGLQSNARFSNRDVTPEEKDIVINEETLLLLDDVFANRPQRPAVFESSMFSSEITRLYKIVTELPTTDGEEFSETNSLPSNLHHLITMRAMRLLGKPTSRLIAGQIYRTLKQTKYKNTWYEVGQTFVPDTDLFYYGEVEQLMKSYFPVRLISSEDIHTTLQSYYNGTKRTNPVIELFENKVRAYQKDFQVNAIELTYSRFPAKVSYSGGVNSDLPENIQEWLINKVISRIANATDQNQQKIQNIKTETL